MTLHLDELRRIVEAAAVAGGSATLATAAGYIGFEHADPSERTQTYSWATLEEWSQALAELADKAKASRPKDPRQVEQEAEALEAFASFEEDCVTLAELLREGGLISAHPDPAALAERYGFDQEEATWFGRWEWMEAIVSPLSIEERDDSPDCNCPHCPEAGDHSTGEGPILHRLILCTGGPHYELQWPKGDPDEAEFIALPWFGRVELAASEAMVKLATWLEDEGEDLGAWDQ